MPEALEDRARIDLTALAKHGDRLAFTTDSLVADPLFFPGGDIGKLAVCGTINDFSVGGAKPLYLSCAVVIEEGIPVAAPRGHPLGQDHERNWLFKEERDMKANLKISLAALAMAANPGAAVAHTGLGDASGFAHGFLHPVGGIDHILAIAAVGMFAAALGGRALWLVPSTFVLVMAAGGALGIAGINVPFVEFGIAASVIVLSLAVALQWSLPTLAAMALVGFFAVFHGYAHGAEMPADASGLGYGLGFMLASALLHAAGIGIGLGIGRIGAGKSGIARQAVGGLMTLAGVGILAGYF